MRNSKLVYLPDWSRDNPYQKLLYSEIAKAGMPCEGLQGSDFTCHWLWNNRRMISHIHLHWLFGVYDSERTGLDRKKAFGFIFKLLLARIFGYKLLWTVHNLISHEAANIKLEFLVRKATARVVNNLIVHCEYAKKIVTESWQVSTDKIVSIPHGSYVGYYPNFATRDEARAKLGVNGDHFTFLFFGMIRNYKGIKPLIRSFLEVKNALTSVQLVIAGKPFDERIKTDLEKMTESSGICLHLKYIPDEEVQYYFNACDAVVLPYHNILTSGAAILAITFAKPVIVPRKGCIPELVTDQIGYLYLDDRELTAAMLAAASDEIPANTDAIAELGASLSWQNVVRKFYGQVLPLQFGLAGHADSASEGTAMSMNSIKISAIICTHNRSDLLPKAIESLVGQTLSKELYEIVVVDNASTDDTVEVCKPYASQPNFRYIYEAVPGLSHARNTGVQKALGNYVAYIDDDAIASSVWLEKLLEAFETVTPRPASVGGIIAPIWEAPKPDWLPQDQLSFLTVLNYGSTPHFIEYPKILYGTNMAFSRQALLAIGGFRADVGRIKSSLLSCEESDVYKKFAEKELLTYYVPEACVRHLVEKKRLSEKWLYRRHYWQGRSEVLLLPEGVSLGFIAADLRQSLRLLLSNLRIFCTPGKDASGRFAAFSSMCKDYGRISQLLVKMRSCKLKADSDQRPVQPSRYDLGRSRMWKPCGAVAIAEPKSDGAGTVRFEGESLADAWSLARSKGLKLNPGGQYRLTGEMRVASISDSTSFLKCEIYQNERWLKNIDSNHYDMSMMGQWQLLQADFTAPEGIDVTSIVTIEKRPYEKAVAAEILIRDLNLQHVECCQSA